MEVGITFYAEENALGEVKKFEWLIEAEGSTSVFTAVTYASGA